MTSYKPIGYGSIFQYRAFIKNNPEVYERFKQIHRENKRKLEEYQSMKDNDLEAKIERGYN